MAAARKKYDDAVALLTAQKFSQAAALLTELMNEVPNGYLDLQQRRDDARTGMRAEGKAALESAQAADGRDNYDGAIELYRRAHQLDPNIQVDQLIQRATDRKLAAGRKKCTDGLLDFSLGNNAAAIPALQEAVRLLPQSDQCFAKARTALQQLLK
jgi:tetratricopeptide (TPR) repeat protein